MTLDQADLDARYGRRPGRDRRRLLTVALVAFVLAVVVWAVWSLVALTRDPLSWRAGAVDSSDPAAVRVTFEVRQPAGRAAVCAVRATAADGAVVGWVDVPVGPVAAASTSATATVRTTRPATGGGVVSCVRR